MLTYLWKCTVLHCNHLGNTWKPLVLMTRHFDYCPSASEWWLLAFLHSVFCYYRNLLCKRTEYKSLSVSQNFLCHVDCFHADMGAAASSLVARWAAESRVERSILLWGNVSSQLHLISPGCPRPNSALIVQKSGLKPVHPSMQIFRHCHILGNRKREISKFHFYQNVIISCINLCVLD